LFNISGFLPRNCLASMKVPPGGTSVLAYSGFSGMSCLAARLNRQAMCDAVAVFITLCWNYDMWDLQLYFLCPCNWIILWYFMCSGVLGILRIRLGTCEIYTGIKEWYEWWVRYDCYVIGRNENSNWMI